MRRGVLLVVVVLATATGTASARADGTTTSTTAETTTGTTTDTTPSYAPLAGSRLTSGCLGAGAFAIDRPDQRILAFGAPASSLVASAYPVDAPLVSFDSSTAGGSTCPSAYVKLSSVSLLGGAVTAATVQAKNGKGRVTGLEIEGAPVDATNGETLLVEGWGQLTLGAESGRLAAPLVLRLLKRHDSLPAGTTIAVAFSAISVPKPALVTESAAKSSSRKQGDRSAATHPTKKHKHRGRKHHRKKGVPQPLKWTPRLGPSKAPYVFPVDGGAPYVDTYGANRSDIYDGWHHGDDLFAPIGTPVLAVTKGKLSLVGWNKLGGWRLWLTDKQGNSFYYAHLAGYSRWILKHRNVTAGEVIGFLGRTGDAFTTPPHLHFEVHPHQLLKLKYDGAVDPTRYLGKWKVVTVPKKEIPQPARLVAPRGEPTQEAGVVWHELLVARHLLPAHPTALSAAFRRPFPNASLLGVRAPRRTVAAVRLSAQIRPRSGGPWQPIALAASAAAIALGLYAVRRRTRRDDQV